MKEVCIAIDPGPVRSAYVVLDRGLPSRFGLDDNATVRRRIEDAQSWGVDTIVIEMIASYGMAVGADVFDTCVWIGRYLETARRCNVQHHYQMKRMEVKNHLCHSSRAKDSNIRQALLDRFGGRDAAVGNVQKPGALHGVRKDIWAALGVAVTWWDNLGNREVNDP